MLKLLKYKIQGNYKQFLGVISISIIINSVMQLFGYNEQSKYIVSILIILITNIIILYWCFSDFDKNISGNEANLIYTLPVKSYKIQLASLMLTSIEIIINELVIGLFIIPNVFKISNSLQGESKIILTMNDFMFFAIFLFCCIIWLFNLSHFFIALSKSCIKNIKFSKAVSYILYFISILAICEFRNCIDVVFKLIFKNYIVRNVDLYAFSNGGRISILFYISNIIYFLIIAIAAFIATSKIFDKKADI
ncbi:MAG: hypothetical protein Q8900_13140 [Bacillota bacterium]|nr:hypothetical protein [Bacillota bacterium]